MSQLSPTFLATSSFFCLQAASQIFYFSSLMCSFFYSLLIKQSFQFLKLQLSSFIFFFKLLNPFQVLRVSRHIFGKQEVLFKLTILFCLTILSIKDVIILHVFLIVFIVEGIRLMHPLFAFRLVQKLITIRGVFTTFFLIVISFAIAFTLSILISTFVFVIFLPLS